MEQKPKSIKEFNPGDIVTRVEVAVSPGSGNFSQVNYDASYIGEKMQFVGIANGCAYFKFADEFSNLLEKDMMFKLDIFTFGDGWSHYIEPSVLWEMLPQNKYISLSDVALFDELQLAIDKEDYIEASKIKSEIDKREL